MKTNAKKPPATVVPANTITQAMLAEYEELCRQEQVRQERRLVLIDLLEDGAAVEKGPLTARLDVSDRVVCSWSKLDELLGPETVESLRSLIEPTVFKQLKVAPCTGKSAA